MRGPILQPRRDSVRDGLGTARLPGRHARRHDERDPQGGAPTAHRATAGVPPALERMVRHCLEKNPSSGFSRRAIWKFDLAEISRSRPARRCAAAGGTLRSRLAPPPDCWSPGAAWRAGGGRRLAWWTPRAGPVAADVPAPHIQARHHRDRAVRARPQNGRLRCGLGGRPRDVPCYRRQPGIAHARHSRQRCLRRLPRRASWRSRCGTGSRSRRRRGRSRARRCSAGAAPREVMDKVEFADWGPTERCRDARHRRRRSPRVPGRHDAGTRRRDPSTRFASRRTAGASRSGNRSRHELGDGRSIEAARSARSPTAGWKSTGWHGWRTAASLVRRQVGGARLGSCTR